MSRLVLKPKEDYRIRTGHLWVFSNEIARVEEAPGSGEIVDVTDSRGGFLGCAYYNRHTLIAARLLTSHHEEIDTAFIEQRLRRALRYREEMLDSLRSFRTVYSESDFLPGLIVDKYENILVVQLLTLGMERLRSRIIEALHRVFQPAGIVLRCDSPFRELEGLPVEATSVVAGTVPDMVVIEEAGARFIVDTMQGQKTGFFFDQRDARAAVRRLARNRRVLDCFSFTGGFSINCAFGGATEVLAVDRSSPALDILNDNARLNGVEKIVSTRQGNCLDILRDLNERKERFDLVILDPPAFIKSKSRLKTGMAGYRDINRLAARLLAPEGILATFSCSQNLNIDQFSKILFQAARSSGRRFRIISSLTQAVDHPVLQAMPETQYLKGLILQAL
ncbi:MAG TPA: class I SAM-dependent rRNA methyltransferase [candidate division Zixibacteria bacterium]|nr:class I SAM-dependent rRNA methyltransferase [candidate division Zixibacteria bacterium]